MLADLQRILSAALYSEDPCAVLRSAAADPHLSAEDRAYLTAMSADGVRIASLLVKKLRFQRITGGDAGAKALFDSDPAAFVLLFRQYAADIPASEMFPDAEGRRFRKWLNDTGRHHAC